MPVTSIGADTSKKLTDLSEDYSPTFLERVTQAPFNVLNAPSNAVKSLVRAAMNQNAGDVLNAAKSLIPFAGSEEVPASDITGSDNFWVNLATDVISDPLMLLGGVGIYTKTGKAAKLVTERAAELTAFKKLGTVEQVAAAEKALQIATDQFKIVKAARPLEPARNIVKFAGKDIGDWDTVRRLAAKGNPLPDVRTAAYQKKLASVTKKLNKGVKEEGQVYYHGTPNAFDNFEANKFNNYIWGTSDPKVAEEFSVINNPMSAATGVSPNIRPFKIKGKLLDTNSQKFFDIAKTITGIEGDRNILKATEPSVVEAVKKAGYVGYEGRVHKTLGHEVVQIFDPKDIIPMSSKDFSPNYLKLFDKQQSLKKELAGLNKGFLTTDQAATVRNYVRKATALFKHKSNNEVLETMKDVTRSNIARDEFLLNKESASALADIDALAKAKGISSVEQATRLLRGAEYRHLFTGGNPDVDKIVLDKIQNAYSEYHTLAGKTETNSIKMQKAFQKFQSKVNTARLEGEEARLSISKFLSEKDSYTPGEIKFLDEYFKTTETLPALESTNGLISEPLRSSKGILSYVQRMRTPEAVALKKKDRPLYNIINHEFGGRIASAQQRKLYPEKDILEINKLIRDTHGIKFDFFDTNIVKAMMDRRMQSIKNVNRSKYLQAAIETMAVPGKSTGKGSMSIEGFIRRVNGSKKLEAGKLNPAWFAEKFKDMKIRAADADEILGTDRILYNSIFNNNKELGSVMRVVEKINAPFRVLLTQLFPDYHARNIAGNSINSWLGGVNPAKQVKLTGKVAKLQHAIYAGKATPVQEKLWEELMQYGIVNRGLEAETKAMFDNFAGKSTTLGKVQKFFERPLGTIIPPFKKLEADPGVGRAFGNFVENNARIVHYLAKKEAGATPLEAMRSVNKYLFDTTKVTEFEKKFARPAFLFYSWTRNNIPLQLGSLLTHPRVAALYTKVTGINHNEIPQYLRSTSAFQSPLNKNEVIGSLGLPIEDLNLFNVADADPQFFAQLSRVSDRIVSRLSPAFRVPLEIMQGRTAYGRKPISDLNTKQLIQEFTPFGRVVRSGEKVIDPESEVSAKLIDLLTGARSYTIDPGRVKVDNMKRALLRSGKFRREGFLVIPKEQYKEDEDVKKSASKLSKAIRQNSKRK